MTWPLIALAIPSVVIGALTFKSLLFGGGFGESIFFSAEHHEVLHEIGESVGDWLHFALHAVANPVFYLMARRRALGLGAVHQVAAPAGRHRLEAQAAALWCSRTSTTSTGSTRTCWPAAAACSASFSGRSATRPSSTGSRSMARRTRIGFIAGIVRRVQSGFLYSYAFWMVIGLAVMLGWFLTRA